jgi:hypothetical protein
MAATKSYLAKESKVALRAAGLPEEVIEFFDTMHTMSQALNNSKNPYQAACTMLERPNNVDIFKDFLARKRNPKGKSKLPDAVTEAIGEHHDEVRKAKDEAAQEFLSDDEVEGDTP